MLVQKDEQFTLRSFVHKYNQLIINFKIIDQVIKRIT